VATAAQHFEQARGHRAYAEHLLVTYPTDPFALQWAVTAAFYAALHALSGHLIQHAVQVTNHQARDAALADPRNGIPQAVYDSYRRLKGRSEGTRYLLWRFTQADVRATVLDIHLARVMAFVRL